MAHPLPFEERNTVGTERVPLDPTATKLLEPSLVTARKIVFDSRLCFDQLTPSCDVSTLPPSPPAMNSSEVCVTKCSPSLPEERTDHVSNASPAKAW